MNKKYRNKLMFWWSLGTAAGIALFWAIYSIYKSIPVITELQLGIYGEIILRLPFTISMRWIVLLGPIYSTIIIHLIFCIKRYTQSDNKYNNDYSLSFPLFSGSLLLFFSIGSIPSWIMYDYSTPLMMHAFWLITWLFLLANQNAIFIYGLISALIAGITAVIIFGLDVGIYIGLFYILIIAFIGALIYGLKCGIGFLIKFISYKRWLARNRKRMAKNR